MRGGPVSIQSMQSATNNQESRLNSRQSHTPFTYTPQASNVMGSPYKAIIGTDASKHPSYSNYNFSEKKSDIG